VKHWLPILLIRFLFATLVTYIISVLSETLVTYNISFLSETLVNYIIYFLSETLVTYIISFLSETVVTYFIFFKDNKHLFTGAQMKDHSEGTDILFGKRGVIEDIFSYYFYSIYRHK
jgi:hypothetical protein